ncbi:MAG: hypothetical protein EAZ95_11510 [Bacteroidetes bacterium]|nr:MAG: hypothetical protein EAZ95_11510 [Bacteroidota bacterium]
MTEELKLIKELVYDICGLELRKLERSLESEEYSACSFELNGKKILYRVSKITPTKIGQFVTIWKRNKEGITIPFDVADDLDFVVITSKNASNLGQFIFPKAVLADNGIITQNGKEGKRGIRIYPAWDITTNKQAKKTQIWQLKYFLDINQPDFDLVKRLLC